MYKLRPIIKFSYFINISILIVVFLIYSCSKTTTPDEYLQDVKIHDIELYNQDVSILTNRLMILQDSIRKVIIEEGKMKSKTVEINIDTIFYGPDNKISLLALLEIENIFSINSEKKSPFITTYSGECYIGFINESKNEIITLKRLKYSFTSRNYKDVKNGLRSLYMREMQYMDGMYNINDRRFWNCLIWKNTY